MKVATVLTALATAFGATHAAECSLSEMKELIVKPETLALGKACSGLNIDPTKSDDTKIKQICGSPTCSVAVAAFAEVLPHCEFQGVSLYDRYQQVVAECNKSSTSSAVTTPLSMATTAVTVAATLIVYARV